MRLVKKSSSTLGGYREVKWQRLEINVQAGDQSAMPVAGVIQDSVVDDDTLKIIVSRYG